MPNFTRAERYSPFTKRYKRVPGCGPRPARCMIIGEKPGEAEARRGLPFVGLTGELVNTILVAANLPRESIFITNLVKEFTEYSKPTAAEVARDWPELMAELDEVKPEVIGLMGTYAVEYFLHRKRAELEKTHGVPLRISSLNGREATVIPMYHPAAGIHDAASLPMILDDFLRLAQVLDGELTVREDKWLGRERYEEWVGEPLRIKLDCAIDTEGTRNKPWCLTYSTANGTAWMTCRNRDGMPRQKVQVESEKVYLHNSLHDLGVLRELGVELRDGQFIDTMVLAYTLCVEPQGLKALAYRHLGAEQLDYSDLIAEPNRLKALDYMLAVTERTWPDPQPYIVLEKGLPRMKRPHNVKKLALRAIADLAADKRNKDGEPVDLRKRWGDWDDEVKGPVVEVLGDMPVATLDDVDAGVAERYSCRDADLTLRLGPILEQKVRDMGLEETVQIDHDILPMVDRMQTVGIKLAPVVFWDDIERQCEAQMGRAKYEIFKLTGAEINPASGDQVAALLYGQMGLTPPRMTDSGARGTVNATALESLLAEAPVVEHVMAYTEANKIKGTYVVPMRKLARESLDQRAHSTMRVTRTTTGRMSMADPPLHQIPIMTELGRQLRGGFVAPEGKVLGDWDLDQIEMRIMAHESRDPELCRLFNTGRDIHTETAAKIFSVSPHSIDGKKDVRRTVAKHAGFGIINGITEHGLLNYLILNRCRRPDGEMWTLDDCVMLLGEWFKIYKGVKRFQMACVAEAQETGLGRETIGGRLIYLPAVWHPVKYVRESAERMSYVMHTQGGAASLIKKCMKKIWDWVCKGVEGVEPLLWVHDENLLEVPDREDVKATVDALVTEAMTTAVKLRVPVKASGGYAQNWLEAH
jgi:uracil-DNA glycosylase family 4